MKKKFISNLLFLIFLNFLVKPVWIFGIDRNVQNMMGNEKYGLYYALLSLSFLFNIFLDLGITQYNNRNIARNRDFLQRQLSRLLGLRFLLAVGYAVVCLGAGLLLGYGPYQMKLLAFLVFNQFLVSFILYLRSNLSGLHMFAIDSALSVTDKLLMILFCAVLMYTAWVSIPFTIEVFIYAQTAAYLLTSLVAWVLVRSRVDKVRLRINWNFYRFVLRRSLPYAMLVLLMMIYFRTDSVMIERLLPGTEGERQAGIYAHAFRLLDAVNMIGVLFAGLLLPIFSRMIKNGQKVNELVWLAFPLLLVPALLVAVSSFFYATPIMELLYTDASPVSANVFVILMIAYVGIACIHIFGTLLTANNKLRIFNRVALLGVVVNILLNFLVIPRYGAEGAAWASLCTQVIVSLLLVAVAFRMFSLRISTTWLSRTLLFLAILVGFARLSLELDPWSVGYILFFILGGILAYVLRVVSLGGIYGVVGGDMQTEDE